VIAMEILEIVRWFNVRKGYGFIKRNGVKENILMPI
jgi:cold shock CspA family protein